MLTTRGHIKVTAIGIVDVCPVLQPEAMLRFEVHADTKGHVDFHGSAVARGHVDVHGPMSSPKAM